LRKKERREEIREKRKEKKRRSKEARKQRKRKTGNSHDPPQQGRAMPPTLGRAQAVTCSLR
jgi:hypothetical protein